LAKSAETDEVDEVEEVEAPRDGHAWVHGRQCAPRVHSFEGDKMKIPAPQSFAEGQRYIYGVLASAAGMSCGAAAGVMVALLMWGGWSAAEQHTIVTIFGWALGGFIAAMIVVIVGLLAGGPVGRVKLSATRDGATFEADCQ
jgi:hypothetical protein